MKPTEKEFLTLTPGAQFGSKGDKLGQVYRDPRTVVKRGSVQISIIFPSEFRITLSKEKIKLGLISRIEIHNCLSWIPGARDSIKVSKGMVDHTQPTDRKFSRAGIFLSKCSQSHPWGSS